MEWPFQIGGRYCVALISFYFVIVVHDVLFEKELVLFLHNTLEDFLLHFIF